MGREHVAQRPLDVPDVPVVLYLFPDGGNGGIHMSGDGDGHRWRHDPEHPEGTVDWGKISGAAGLGGVA